MKQQPTCWNYGLDVILSSSKLFLFLSLNGAYIVEEHNVIQLNSRCFDQTGERTRDLLQSKWARYKLYYHGGHWNEGFLLISCTNTTDHHDMTNVLVNIQFSAHGTILE
jgi:hypothetical protein